MWAIGCVIALSYVLGSFPTSIVAGRLLKGIDIREHGSGNAGATNVYRVMGLGPAVLVGLVDVGKGLMAVLVVSRIGTGTILGTIVLQILAGLAAIAGHIWPVLAGFRGGRGVLTAAGVLIGLVPGAVVAAVVVWGIVTFSTGYVSLGSISAALTLSVMLFLGRFGLGRYPSNELLLFGCLVSVLIILRHWANIGRLLRGEENRFGRRSSKQP